MRALYLRLTCNIQTLMHSKKLMLFWASASLKLNIGTSLPIMAISQLESVSSVFKLVSLDVIVEQWCHIG